MHNRKLMGVVRYDPVQTPFEHCKRLIDRQRFEGADAIEVEVDLRSEPASQSVRRGNIDSKVDQCVVRTERKISIKLNNAATDLRQTRGQRYVKSTN